jgi:protein-S-isoprenylcysteine O-methyltransferase Ste14
MKIKPCSHSDTSRKRVITLFFLSLLFMAILAIGIGKVVGNFGVFHLGWLHPVIGLALVMSGFALVIWSVRVQYEIGKGTPTPWFATQKLVTQGPYTYTRNPMTLGSLLLYLGIGVWIGSGVVIFLTVMIFSGLLMFIYHHETRELTDRFKDEYLEYINRTPFLRPRFW